MISSALHWLGQAVATVITLPGRIINAVGDAIGQRLNAFSGAIHDAVAQAASSGHALLRGWPADPVVSCLLACVLVCAATNVLLVGYAMSARRARS